MTYCSAAISAANSLLLRARNVLSRLLLGEEASPGAVYVTELSGAEIALHVALAPSGPWRKLTRRWKKALRVHPNSSRILNNLGVAYEQRGLVELAGESYRRALELAPDNAAIRRNYELFVRATKRTSGDSR